MAKVVDPKNLPDKQTAIPGIKPPVREFSPLDDGDPAEVDAFNQFVRDLRNQSPAIRLDRR